MFDVCCFEGMTRGNSGMLLAGSHFHHLNLAHGWKATPQKHNVKLGTPIKQTLLVCCLLCFPRVVRSTSFFAGSQKSRRLNSIYQSPRRSNRQPYHGCVNLHDNAHPYQPSRPNIGQRQFVKLVRFRLSLRAHKRSAWWCAPLPA